MKYRKDATPIETINRILFILKECKIKVTAPSVSEIVSEKNQVDIVNYDEIIDFSLNKISVKYRNKIFVIEGTNMVISKMLDNEILITGNISNLRIN